MVPMWVFWELLILVLLMTIEFVLGLIVHIRSHFPFTDHGFRIYNCKDDRALDIIRGIAARHGLSVKREINTPSIRRVLLSDCMTVLNVVRNPKIAAKMGGKALPGLALVATNPTADAYYDAYKLYADGYESKVLGELDPDAPEGSLVFMQTAAFPGQVLVYRKHILDMDEPKES